MDYKTKDHDHLNGKEVTVWVLVDNEPIDYKAVVVGLDYSVGVTIAMSEDQKWYSEDGLSFEDCKKGQELFCLNGELSPHGSDRFYDEKFKQILKMIEKGFVDYRKIQKLHRELHYGYSSFVLATSGGMSPCSYK